MKHLEDIVVGSVEIFVHYQVSEVEIISFAMRYDKKLGMGTLISMMIPYSMAYLVGWMILFYVWVFALGLPVGPGTPTFYP